MPIAIGGVNVTYTIKFWDAPGTTLLAEIGDWSTLEGARIANEMGVTSIVIPGYYPSDIVERLFGFVTFERALGNSAPTLLWDQCYQRVAWDYTFDGEERLWRVTCVDGNIIPKKTVVDYPEGDPKAEVQDMADDLMKDVMTNNRVSATDTTRNTTLLTVQAKVGAAYTVRKAFSENNALSLFQTLAQESSDNGTPLYFDTICKTPPNNGTPPTFEFRTYTGQRGADHRNPSGAQGPIQIGPDYGNLDKGALSYNGLESASRAIVGGRGNGASRIFKRSNNAAMQALSPLGLWEAYRDQTDVREASADAILQGRADAMVNSMRPKRSMSGKLVQNEGLLFGVNIGFGDFLTPSVDGRGMDAHLDAIYLKATRDESEQLDITLRSEEDA
jgi:hypothetical protein